MCNGKNVGSIDRSVRLVVGIAALAVAFLVFNVQEFTIQGFIAAAAGVIMLGTAALGMCPLYLPFRVSTCKVAKVG
jgi:hypothetical protein